MLIRCTVLFESPFWVGLFERQESRDLQVARVVFGAEPTSAQLYEFLLREAYRLPFGPPHRVGRAELGARNPKRVLREARQFHEPARSTKAQAALQADREARKQETKVQKREHRKEEAEQRYKLRRQKAKAKHQGH